MACQAMHSWTFIGLLGAFLDLAIAYLLLCTSTLAFFTSKVLGFFGLCLPCACNGLFGNPNRNYCMRRLLVDYPLESVSSVRLSVKSKFPFGSIRPKDHDYQLNLKLIRDRDTNSVNGSLVMEGEASCSSLPGSSMEEKDLVLRNESVKGIDAGNESVHVKERRFDVKGKGIVNHGPKNCVRQRRVSCFDPSCGDGESHPSTNHIGNKAIECCSLPVDSGADADHFHDDDETLSITNFTENAIKMLEQALEQKHVAYAALFLELEKERNAAASTTDEAIAMVLCLQEKMASVEMEARQYKRIIEEKLSYDAEEMNILKEILVRRELEKHFLEKRVEAYSSRKHKFSENAIYLESGEQEKNSSASPQEEKVTKTIKTRNVNVVHILYDGENLKQHVNDAFQSSKSSGDMISDMEAHVHDFHVRDGYKDKETLWKNSMSLVDNERLKIYPGVEWLREKFRIVEE
ncbi:hypothetical protein Vadar_010008 [Vaccinium darrowii]|uniref:Uncharacterized protein n=1 Tax=Vaccinium darrowii TaxID=229202 RepID=A0ACB7YUD8_9ERIC|nr:hypothetical protein Vadar_010008 [Vaccinium darrowii]